MKNKLNITTVLLLMSALTSCSVKSTSSKVSTSTSTSATGTSPTTGSTGSSGTGGSSGSDTSNVTCQEIVDGKCYRKVSNIQASGGSYGQTWWSSTNYTASGSALSPNLFATDAVFNVRIIPRSPTANATSTFNRVCSPYMMYATKVKVQFMLHKQGVTVGDVGTVFAPLNSTSGIYKFAVPASSEPLVLEVVNVQSDSRCASKSGSTTQSYYGTIPSSCSSNPYLDIPINGGSYPTECVAFDILYSTDETWSIQ
jgi:hypothetical protein